MTESQSSIVSEEELDENYKFLMNYLERKVEEYKKFAVKCEKLEKETKKGTLLPADKFYSLATYTNSELENLTDLVRAIFALAFKTARELDQKSRELKNIRQELGLHGIAITGVNERVGKILDEPAFKLVERVHQKYEDAVNKPNKKEKISDGVV
jgi:hypothetical protein